MRERLVTLGLVTFGVPLLYLGAELVAWLVHGPSLIRVLVKQMPDVLKVLVGMYVVAVAYSSSRVIWPVTSEVQSAVLRSSARVAGLIFLTLACVVGGFIVVATWTPLVTVRFHG